MASESIPKDLLLLQQKLHEISNTNFTSLKEELESHDYAAHTFILSENTVIYREAKITPTKIGQFVTIWKRIPHGTIAPFHISDTFDYIMIATRKEDFFGVFIFPKAVLVGKSIVSTTNKEGKRGIRVYPPWDTAVNPQAQKTQKWQTDYFLEIPLHAPVNPLRLQQLLT